MAGPTSRDSHEGGKAGLRRDLPKRSSLLRSLVVGRTVRAAIGAPTLKAGLVECTNRTKPRCSVCRGSDLKCAQGLAHGGMVPMVKGGTSGDGAGTGF